MRPSRASALLALALAAAMPLSGCALGPSHTVHDPSQQAAIDRVQTYFDNLRSLRAAFTQLGPEGDAASGTAWYEPGHLSLQYDRPVRRLLVAGNGRLVVHDDATGSITRASLDVNPLGLLLAGPVRLSGEIDVTDVREVPGALQLSMARTSNPAQGLLTLMFRIGAGGTLQLTGLEAVDSHQRRTHFLLSDQQEGLALDPSLFVPPSS
ncbi:LolA family protein [Rhizosaccharibacter radicis]|uniref:Outer membrane lipoprotein carrier protein LolA n=1 Tax=Rhizosaccharibacter radicis TaxID=2782605 RepID=A0ABT1VWX7_9PROT|nr:outer membrane lipoprotein carrier protein LolA [Acetobacteraceae bacterium KSS12]